MLHDDMIDYYARRAKEYEEVYYRDDPHRQAAIKRMAKALQTYLKGEKVLELACGIGFWTQLLSQSAQSIVATDINESAIEVAKSRKYKCKVDFKREDVYDLSFSQNEFTGGITHFLFSHIPKSRIDEFLNNFHKVLAPGAKVFISDDMLQPLDKPVTKPHDNNTYSHRGLSDGSEYLILKNFYTADELADIFRKHIPDFSAKNVYFDEYFWYVSYELKKQY